MDLRFRQISCARRIEAGIAEFTGAPTSGLAQDRILYTPYLDTTKNTRQSWQMKTSRLPGLPTVSALMLAAVMVVWLGVAGPLNIQSADIYGLAALLIFLAVIAAIAWARRDKKRDIFDVLTLLALIGAFGAAGVAAYWSKKLTIDAEQTAKRQFRAHLLFEGGDAALAPDRKSYAVGITAKNSGQTPAWNARYSWNSGVFEFPLKTRLPSQEFLDYESADVAAGGTLVLGDTKIVQISDEEMRYVYARTKAIYVWGRLKFKDTFQRDQSVEFTGINLYDFNCDTWKIRNYFHSSSDQLD